MAEHVYQALDPEKVVATIERLAARIEKRFPQSGLSQVCATLQTIGKHAREQSQWITQPIVGLRIGTGLLIALIIAGILVSLRSLVIPQEPLRLMEFVQAAESAINDVVLVGVAVFFLVSLERRIKRTRGLKAIHELRALAHIIDMHQLTKDPDRLLWESAGSLTSTPRSLTPLQLTRYLDYCSEMLSLIGKIGALYVQRFDDPVMLSAVNEIEELTTGLSRKIWQKLMIIHSDQSLVKSRRT